jgi:hypothetical protein
VSAVAVNEQEAQIFPAASDTMKLCEVRIW